MLTLLTLLLPISALTQQILHSLPTFLMRTWAWKELMTHQWLRNFSVIVSLAMQLIIPVEAELMKCKEISIK